MVRAYLDRHRRPPGLPRGWRRKRRLAELNKPDGVSQEICKALRGVGCQVTQITSAAGRAGVPDILVSFGGKWFVAEIKMPKGILSTEQVRWHHEAQAPVHVIRSVADALNMLGLVAMT